MYAAPSHLVDEVQTGRSGNGGDETREFPSRSSPPAFESSREFRLSTVTMSPLTAARAAAGFSRVPRRALRRGRRLDEGAAAPQKVNKIKLLLLSF